MLMTEKRRTASWVCRSLVHQSSWPPADQEAASTSIGGSMADSTGRRNTLIVEVFMGRPAGWMQGLTGRAPMKSPGMPSLRRDVERQFWCEIAKGLTSEDAALAVGASPAAGGRWFRKRGGLPGV